METNRKLFLFIAMSLDGYIAGPGGELDFLSGVEKEGEDYGYSDFIEEVDTVVLGRKTYDKILSMGTRDPYGAREVYVLTHQPKADTGNVHYYGGSLPDLIVSLQGRQGKHIYCDGGADTIHQLLEADLIEEMIVSIIPVLLGEGISLFKGGLKEKKLSLQSVIAYEKGLVKLHYLFEKRR